MTIKYADIIIKAGAVSSLIGTFILILLVLVLVIFPVQKICDGVAVNCEYISSAPNMLATIVSPQTLVASLLTIAGGIFMFRFGTWYKIRRDKL